MPTKQAYDNRVENKLVLFKTQIEALQAFEADSEEAHKDKIHFQIKFLLQKQKALEEKFLAFQAAGGAVRQELKNGIDAQMRDMIRSISKVHLQCIEDVY